MAAFEEVVRPFQARNVVARRRIIYAVSEETSSGTATLTWGKAGEIATGAEQDKGADLGISFKVKHETDRSWVQTAKTTETKRITNVADDSQYVDVQRIKAITFQDQNKRPESEALRQIRYTSNLIAVDDYLSAAVPAKKEKAKFTLKFND